MFTVAPARRDGGVSTLTGRNPRTLFHLRRVRTTRRSSPASVLRLTTEVWGSLHEVTGTVRPGPDPTESVHGP